ncbi:LysM peptidoglycan-binding domain-containing protein [Flavobacterium sp.]|jgi:cell wall-associated NlpC family hydrolase|uniref:LysM peptidoglycan-binding domain-containing protein n=1 Tax=Flavobacterium sp. TaxID=239 RepID=UPI0037C1638C
MKFNILFILITFFVSANSFAQKIINHNVKSGESIYSIAKKYDVTQAEIFDLNPKLKGAVLGLKEEVKIPNKKYKPEEKKPKVAKNEVVVVAESEKTSSSEPYITHKVEAKETLYSLAKKYNVSMESICDLNPELKTGNLKVGAKLKFVNPNPTPAVTENNVAETQKVDEIANVNVVHKVLPKETLYKISKQYNVKIDELVKLNPGVENGLPVDYLLIVKKGSGTNAVIEEAESHATETASAEIENKVIPVGNLAKAQFLIEKASEHLGTRYRSGGTTSAGFDCSGLMFSTFKNLDITLPRSSHEMARYGTKIDKSQAQKGDLIFFATFGGSRVSHVGMVTEVLDDEIRFIHSSTSSGVMYSSTKERYYARTFVQVNRVIAE